MQYLVIYNKTIIPLTLVRYELDISHLVCYLKVHTQGAFEE